MNGFRISENSILPICNLPAICTRLEQPIGSDNIFVFSMIELPVANQRQILIYNTADQVVRQINQPSENILELSLTNFKAGFYMVQIQIDETMMTKRLVIVK